jgi:hypothetical protein
MMLTRPVLRQYLVSIRVINVPAVGISGSSRWHSRPSCWDECLLPCFYTGTSGSQISKRTFASGCRHAWSTIAYTEDELNIARNAYLDGMHTAEIQRLIQRNGRPAPDMERLLRKALGTTRRQARSHIKSVSPARRWQPWTQDELDALFAGRSAGRTTKDLAVELGRSMSSIEWKLAGPKVLPGVK